MPCGQGSYKTPRGASLLDLDVDGFGGGEETFVEPFEAELAGGDASDDGVEADDDASGRGVVVDAAMDEDAFESRDILQTRDFALTEIVVVAFF